MPVPVSAIDFVPLDVEKLRVAWRAPGPVGANATVTLQLAPGASVCPAQVSEPKKSSGFGPLSPIESTETGLAP